MRNRLFHLASLLLLISAELPAQVTNAFTYQGELEQSASPASGNFDFEFELYDAPGGGAAIAGPAIVTDVLVDGGLFSTQVDFGMDVFGIDDAWLEVRVREAGSGHPFTILSPRQLITPAPLSLHTLNVEPGVVGTAEVDSGEVQLRVDGSCSPGSWIRAVNEGGSVQCEDHAPGNPTAVIESDTTPGDFILLDGDPTTIGSIDLPSSGTWLVQGAVTVALTTPEQSLARCRVANGPEITQSTTTPTTDLDRIVIEYSPRAMVTVGQQNQVVNLTCTGEADGSEPPTILPNTTFTFTAIEVSPPN